MDLKKLQQATNLAIEKAHASKEPFGAINWGDLSCFCAERTEDQDGEIGHQVWIEEASPFADTFQLFIAAELAKAGFPGVLVFTEWYSHFPSTISRAMSRKNAPAL